MHLLHTLDLAILRQINLAWANPFFDRLMPIVSDPNFFRWPILIAAVLFLLFGGFRGRVFVFLILLAVGVGDGVIVEHGKKWVRRARPNEAIAGLRMPSRQGLKESQVLPHPGRRSFPSGHTCNNVALAVVACAVYGLRRAWWLWLWAALMGYSRVYLAAHYPTDVFFSALFSAAYTLALLALARLAWNHWTPRRWRAAHPDLLPLWGKAA
ncbi:MAG: phosphatase PAP2 family protein [Verrucomicrobium sp.]|nr:phosphatase PAP2 family protein [Verrucomicrobium sp.]